MTIGRIPSVEGGIQPTIVDAKGDILTATAADTPAVLAVGNNGETLVADSSATTGLRWQNSFAAGKNKIINGDFTINQRGFTSTTTDSTYGLDRWQLRTQGTGGTTTYSVQSFTPGTAPVAGYEGSTFARLVTASFTGTNTLVQLVQNIENVRSFAGQTVTVSFWAKSGSGTPNIIPYLVQNFGSGGSPSSEVLTPASAVQAISTSWARYSFTIAVPSISGKTIGTTANTSYLAFRILVAAGSDFASPYNSVGVQNNTFDIWGVQVEAGSTATAFQTATGTLAGELVACQRYYFRNTAFSLYAPMASGWESSTTNMNAFFNLPVTLRAAPTAVEYANLMVNDTSGDVNVTAITIGDSSRNLVKFNVTAASGFASGRVAQLLAQNSTSAYIAVTAEL